MDMQPHPDKLVTIGLVKPAGIRAGTLAVIPVATAATGTAGVLVDVVHLVVIVVIAEVTVANVGIAIPIIAMLMPVDHAQGTIRTTTQDLVVMEERPLVPI